jgi:hypothetical protein
VIYLAAFVDELEKIAAGPARIVDEQLPPGTAQYWQPHKVDAVDAAHPQIGLKRHVGKRHGALLSGPSPQFPSFEENAASRGLRRHELTHWLRDRKGKMTGVGKPGFGNVLRTAREEAVAYGGELKSLRRAGAPHMQPLSVMTIPKRFLGSMKAAYPKGILRAALGAA